MFPASTQKLVCNMTSACVESVLWPFNYLLISSHHTKRCCNGLDRQLSQIRARRKAITAHVCDAAIF